MALLFAPVNADGLIADLDLPSPAYRVLMKLRSLSEPGGRVEIDQATIAKLLETSRPNVTAALRSLDLARLVKKQRNGVYQINAMLAGYTSEKEAVAAIQAMDAIERLDNPLFIEDYHRAVAEYQDQLAAQRLKREQKKTRTKQRGPMRVVSSTA
ncbi:MarR family transcriptional regulator [Streptomyces nanshensis]|uniref:Regulator n=1 Tax=Streptomyces nanshensis TaxID=518642 RepID=A0A1E7L2Y3_9ACTN|nr:MarR family transcriptional regulator [Streptomyces nanshensis]OEV10557.1 regulator [Streptomyces nanshensis]